MRKIFLIFTLVMLTNFAQSTIEETMQDKISTLGIGQSFAYLDLELTDLEFDLIDKIKFDNMNPDNDARVYNQYGNLHLIKEELPKFLRSIGNDDEDVIQAVTDIIDRTTKQVINASGKNSAWLAVRAFTPTHRFDVPRWHIDGQFYGLNGPHPYPGIMFKFAAVLKGKATLLYHLPDDMRGVFNAHFDWYHREQVIKLLDFELAESPKKGEGVFFIVGNNDTGAVHSEPKIEENRLFFSILIGDESEINELDLRWNQISTDYQE